MGKDSHAQTVVRQEKRDVMKGWMDKYPSGI